MSPPLFSRFQAEFALLTPAFIGGADPGQPGLDAKAIKAALRYWWRVLALKRFQLATDTSDHQPLQALHRREGELFGSPAEQGGQAWVQVVLRQTSAGRIDFATGKIPPPGLQYLLGQGLYGLTKEESEANRNKPKGDPSKIKPHHLRKALHDATFCIDLIIFPRARKDKNKNLIPLPPNALESAEQEVLDALRAFGCLGGLGSRKNRGWGSVQLRAVKKLESDDKATALNIVPANSTEYEQILQALFASEQSTLPLLPCFSRRASCILLRGDGSSEVPQDLDSNPDPRQRPLRMHLQDRQYTPLKAGTALDLLNQIGIQYLQERSWGKTENGVAKTSAWKIAEQNFKDDHDLIKFALREDRKYKPQTNQFLQRAIFGLPLGFGKGSQANLCLNSTPTRRASPLFFHIAEFEGQPLAVLYTLPSRFMPADSELTMDGLTYQVTAGNANAKYDWSLLNTFLSRFHRATRIQWGSTT